MPDLFHIIPIGYNIIFDGVFQGKDTTFVLGLCRGRPTIEGNTARGVSSPAKLALHIPDPLSTTRALTSTSSSSDALIV